MLRERLRSSAALSIFAVVAKIDLARFEAKLLTARETAELPLFRRRILRRSQAVERIDGLLHGSPLDRPLAEEETDYVNAAKCGRGTARFDRDADGPRCPL